MCCSILWIFVHRLFISLLSKGGRNPALFLYKRRRGNMAEIFVDKKMINTERDFKILFDRSFSSSKQNLRNEKKTNDSYNEFILE